jgi:hypothetical protein
MQRYKDLSGSSGVRAFEVLPHAIRIEFKDGGRYLYDHSVPGRAHVEAMKRLALAGQGLATYINRYVREDFAKKD